MKRKHKSRESLIHTARSIQARIERGEGEERKNTKLLDRFMKRHHLNQEDIGIGHVRKFTFTVAPHWQWLFTQIAATVLGDLKFPVAENGHAILVLCAEEDVAKLWAKFDRYQRIYIQEEQLLRIAFVQVNDLWPLAEVLHAPAVNAPRATQPSPQPNVECATLDNAEKEPEVVTELPHHNLDEFPQEINELRVAGMRQLLRKLPFHVPIGNGESIPATDHTNHS
jgi:hypothetical protein